MATQNSPKPADSAKPTTGQPTSNLFNAFQPSASLFNAFQPSASANASNYNPYNSSAVNQALADQNNASYWAGQSQLGQAKEAASFGASVGVQAQAAKDANQAASQQSQQQQQQQQQQITALSPTSGLNQGRPAFSSLGGQPAKPGYNLSDRVAAMQLQDRQQREFQNNVFQSERDRYNQQLLANNAVSNQTQLTAQNQRGEQALAQIQGANQLEAAKIAANAQLGAAGIGAQSNMVSSLFGSLGNMVSSIGGGGGRRGYW